MIIGCITIYLLLRGFVIFLLLSVFLCANIMQMYEYLCKNGKFVLFVVK